MKPERGIDLPLIPRPMAECSLSIRARVHSGKSHLCSKSPLTNKLNRLYSLRQDPLEINPTPVYLGNPLVKMKKNKSWIFRSLNSPSKKVLYLPMCQHTSRKNYNNLVWGSRHPNKPHLQVKKVSKRIATKN